MKSYPSAEESEKIVESAAEWTNKHANIIFAADGEGLGKDIVMVSFHKNYSLYSDFMRTFAMDWARFVSEFDSFLVSINSGFKIKPSDLKYLADGL